MTESKTLQTLDWLIERQQVLNSVASNISSTNLAIARAILLLSKEMPNGIRDETMAAMGAMLKHVDEQTKSLQRLADIEAPTP